MNTINFIALQAASNAFATEQMPDDWEDLNEEQQENWLADHRWYHFESDTNDAFFALIDTHSDFVKEAIHHALNQLKEKLVEAAIDASLPSDFNELDLHAMIGLR